MGRSTSLQSMKHSESAPVNIGKRGSEPEVLGAVHWERAQEVVGDLMQPLGMYPERHKVEAFPSDEQLDAMGVEWIN